jgi:DNA-binding NtrC family response regulator
VLSAYPDVSLVFTDVSHADGNWSDLLRFVVNRGIAAHVVVCSRRADEGLWSEVLWRGGYDVLVEPFDREELARIVEGALRTMNPRLSARTAVA